MDIARLFSQTITAWFEDSASRQAAALAYYGILSLAPLLIIAISIAGVFLGRADIEQQVIAEVEERVGGGSADLVAGALDATYNGGGGAIATIISVLLLLFAATNIFFQLKTSLNRIMNVQHQAGDDEEGALVQSVLRLAGDRLLAAVMVLGVGLALLVFQAVNMAISIAISVAGELALNTTLLLEVLNTLASIGFVAMIISLIFRYVPDRQLAWREVWLGSLFTAVLFAIGQQAIGFYLESSSVASAYGVAGSVIIVLLWIYYSTSILLFGAEFTHVYAHLYGSHSDASDTGPADERRSASPPRS